MPLADQPLLWNVRATATEPRDPALLDNLFATLPPTETVALELAAEPERCRLLARAWSPAGSQALTEALYAALPQAQLDPLTATDDPAQPPTGSVGRAFELSLRESEIFSLRSLQRPSLDPASDPLALLVRSFQGLSSGERCLLRLTLRPAPDGWQQPYRAWQRDVDLTRSPRGWPTSAGEAIATQSSGLFLALMTALLLFLLAGQALLGRPAWLGWLLGLSPLWLALLGGATLASLVGGLLISLSLGRRLLGGRRLIPNQALLAEKLSRPGCLTRLQLWCWGLDEPTVRRRLQRITGALRQYTRGDGNSLVARPSRSAAMGPPVALGRCWLGLGRRAPILSTAELASLWGPIGGLTDAADLTPGGSLRRRPPRFGPDGRPWLIDGCPIGESEQGGVRRQIAYPRALLQRVNAIFGGTGSGKSTLLTNLVVDALLDAERSLVLFDSHSRLAQTVLGLVPAARARDVVLIDLGETESSLALNLLDVTGGRPPERLVADTISALARLWPDSWGDRMEQVLRAALTVLVEANCQRQPAEQFTLFQIVDLLLNARFRQAVLSHYAPARWQEQFWQEYFGSRSAHLREEMINPVLTKLFKLRDLPAARRLLGQPHSSLDLTQAVLNRKVVLVDLAQGSVGEELAGLVGALIMSCVDQAIISQARRAPTALAQGTVIFDEFETMPAINYDRIIAQLRKYGFGFFFATQSPEALAQRNPVLLAQLRDNCQALLLFRTSAEAAQLLVGAFDGVVRPTDVANLATGCCYVKLEERQQPVPAFWLRVRPAAVSSPSLATRLSATSRARYAVPVAQADAAIAGLESLVTHLGSVTSPEPPSPLTTHHSQPPLCPSPSAHPSPLAATTLAAPADALLDRSAGPAPGPALIGPGQPAAPPGLRALTDSPPPPDGRRPTRRGRRGSRRIPEPG